METVDWRPRKLRFQQREKSLRGRVLVVTAVSPLLISKMIKNSHIWYLVPAITAFPLKPIVEWRPLSRFLSKLSNSHITLKVNVFSRGGGSFLCYIHDSFFFFKSRYDHILGRNFTLWRTMFIVDVYNRPRTCNIKKMDLKSYTVNLII